jgi:predicted RNase H-related nuclease YkuK (DUF458 family)
MSAKRAASVQIEEIMGEDDSKRPRTDSVQDTVAVYSATTAAAAEEELPKDWDVVQVKRSETDSMLCIFERDEEATRAVSWVDKMVYNLRLNPCDVVTCEWPYINMRSVMNFVRECLDLEKYKSSFLPDVCDSMVVKKLETKKTIYDIGMHVKGGADSFFFFDIAHVRRHRSVYGEFLTVRWDNIHEHNRMFSNVMQMYLQESSLKLQHNVIIDMPSDANMTKKLEFVRKFFLISKKKNPLVFCSGDLLRTLIAEPYTVDRFEDKFEFTFDEKERPSEEVSLIMGAVIEGVKRSRNEIQYTTVNSRKPISEQQYSLAIKPMVFFEIEQVVV